MTNSPIGLTQAAAALGISINTLRAAIAAGKIPGPARLPATATLPADWLESTLALVKDAPEKLTRGRPQKVPAFARYEGTSAWRKYKNRVRDYARHQAAAG